MTLYAEPMTCCFCGIDPELNEYVELETHIDGSEAVQFFGAHRTCLVERLRDGVTFELEADDQDG